MGCPEIVSILLANGADWEVMDIYGNTPLDDAIVNDNEEVAALLSSGEIIYNSE